MANPFDLNEDINSAVNRLLEQEPKEGETPDEAKPTEGEPAEQELGKEEEPKKLSGKELFVPRRAGKERLELRAQRQFQEMEKMGLGKWIKDSQHLSKSRQLSGKSLVFRDSMAKIFEQLSFNPGQSYWCDESDSPREKGQEVRAEGSYSGDRDVMRVLDMLYKNKLFREVGKTELVVKQGVLSRIYKAEKLEYKGLTGQGTEYPYTILRCTVSNETGPGGMWVFWFSSK